RRPMDRPGRGRRGRSGGCALGLTVRALPLTPGPHLRRQAALGDAAPVRRTRRSTGRCRRHSMNPAKDVAQSTQSHDPAPPCVMVIFGGAGDLTKRKLVPALYNLATSGLLGEAFAIVAIA